MLRRTRRLEAVVLLVLLAVAGPPVAEGVSLRRQCARACRDDVRGCLATTRGQLLAAGATRRQVRRATPAIRRSCRARLVDACRHGGGLAVCQAGAPGGNAATIGPTGGTVTLAGIADVTFSPGAFATPQAVRIETSTDADAAARFADTATIFEPGPRAGYDVAVVTGDVAPVGVVTVRLTIPPEVGPADLVSAFGDFFTASELDMLEQFELIDTPIRDATSLTVVVDGSRFTSLRRADGAHELRLTLAGSPPPAADALVRARSPRAARDGCAGQPLGPPLATIAVRSPFDPERRLVRDGRVYVGHYGTDLVADGNPVFASGEGTVVASYTSPDFGETIVVSIPGTGAVRYAHLQSGSRLVAQGDKVCSGQKLGTSDNTGLSTGPHLHFEYAPSGAFGSNTAKVDPAPCIDPGLRGFDFKGTWRGLTRATTHVPFTGANVGIDESIQAVVTLRSEGCLGLVPAEGTVTLERTDTYAGGSGETCRLRYTGTGVITDKGPAGGLLSFLFPGPVDIAYTGAMQLQMDLTATDSCTGRTTVVPTPVGWLLIPLETDGSGPRVAYDVDAIAGTIFPPGPPGGTLEMAWDFQR